jgi:hypothetical protein
MKAEPTKGPWIAMPFGVGGSCVAIVSECNPTENLLGVYEDAENEGLAVFTRAPDGYLAASAPALLEALQGLVETLSREVHSGLAVSAPLAGKLRDAVVAIKQAEGTK